MDAISASEDALIFGIDFSSAPTRKKPIVCAQGCLNKQLLTIQACHFLTSLDQFEAFLAQDGAWIAALDFPFGQPHKLLLQLGWPELWEEYVRLVAEMGKATFEQTLAEYRESRPVGDKLHLRA